MPPRAEAVAEPPPMRRGRGDSGLRAAIIVLVLCTMSYYAGANPDQVQEMLGELRELVQR